MNALTKLTCLLLTPLLALMGALSAHGANYPAAIQYKQTMVKVADEANSAFHLGDWGGANSRYFTEIVTSADGTKVGFVVKLNSFIDKHIYVMNADGSGVVDLTSNVPSGMSANDIANLQINDPGSRLFFRAYSLGNVYYFDTASHTSQTAFLGQTSPDSREPYTLNGDGSRLYFQHSWVPPSGISHFGIVYADVGTNMAVPVFDLASLNPPGPDWNFRYLGAGRSGATMLFTYYPDYWHDNLWAMYKTGLPPGTAATRVPDERHAFVWGEQDLPDNIVSADGGRALYACQDSGGSEQLYYVNLASGAKTIIAPNCGGVTFPAMSPNGAFARFGALGYYNTRVNLATGDKRDTSSYWFGEAAAVGASNLTDLTADNRYYFLGSGPYGLPARIHRIDMAPSGSTAPAPDITSISFSKPQIILNDDTHPVTVTVQVNDPGGLANIQWVKMHSLVEGREFPAGQVYEPLSYNNLLTNVGGGTFTTTMTTNKWFYITNPVPPLPRRIGVRIIAKNSAEHYVMADAVITVTTKGALSGSGARSLLLID